MTGFLGGIFEGAYPDIMLDGLNTHMPKGWQDDMLIISQNMDWLGINYYKRSLFSPNTGMWPHFDTSSGTLPKTQMGWEIYPQGLYETLKRTAELYSKDLPIFITENGMANDDAVVNGAVADHIRLDYLNDHILAVAKLLRMVCLWPDILRGLCWITMNGPLAMKDVLALCM